MTPQELADSVKRLREADIKNEMLGTKTINALVDLLAEMRWYDKANALLTALKEQGE